MLSKNFDNATSLFNYNFHQFSKMSFKESIGMILIYIENLVVQNEKIFKTREIPIGDFSGEILKEHHARKSSRKNTKKDLINFFKF